MSYNDNDDRDDDQYYDDDHDQSNDEDNNQDVFVHSANGTRRVTETRHHREQTEISPSTFGIEFEANCITDQGVVSSNVRCKSDTLRSGWNIQDDPTTMIEINSPIFEDVVSASSEIGKQFSAWIGKHSIAFYAYNANQHVDEALTSSGQHIHIGTDPQTTSRMEFETKNTFARHIREVYPLLMAISAQPTPSKRMLYGQYCMSMSNYSYMPREENSHGQELNYSHLGTVECRVFDTNIPQCSLAEAWMLTKICDHSRREKIKSHRDVCTKTFDTRRYDSLRQLACTHGYTDLPISELLTQVKTMIQDENINNFELPSIRDIYYLMARYSLNPSDIYHLIKPNKYTYFKTMFESPDKYLANLVTLTENNQPLNKAFQRMLNESMDLTSFDQLIALTADNTNNLFNVKQVKPKQTMIPIEVVKAKIASGEYEIKRLSELNITSTESAIEIAHMIDDYSSSIINRVTAHSILEANERYYVLVCNINNKQVILGAVAIRLSTREVSHLVTKKEYGRIGIATMLLKFLVSIATESCFQNLITYVKKDNEVSKKMFEHLGFKIEHMSGVSPDITPLVLNIENTLEVIV
jgi:predicted GNAT family acetyltransferase